MFGNLATFVKRIFTDKNKDENVIDIKQEEEMYEEYVEDDVVEETNGKTYVILYTPSDEARCGSDLHILCEFHNNILPEVGSIIWIGSEDELPLPYRCIRFDYFENNTIDAENLYVVVEPAKESDIMPHKFYGGGN